MCNAEDTTRIEKEQAEHAGDVAPAGAVTVDRALIREKNLTLRELGRKICNTCGVEQDLHADYQPDKRLPDGRAGRCRTCANSQRQADRAAANGLKQAPRNGYHRADYYGRPAVFVPEQEIIAFWRSRGLDENRCAYSQVELTPEPYQSNSRTIDHVQPLSAPDSAGHVLENLVPCSRDYNTYKRDGRAVEKYMSRPLDEFPPLFSYVGLAPGHAGVDEHGNPLAPAQVEWSDGDSPAVEFTPADQGAE